MEPASRMFTPKEFAFADGELAEAIRLPAREGGWGLMFCLDDRDLRYTRAGDPEYLRLMLNLPPDAKPGTVPPVPLAETGLVGTSLAAFPLIKRGWPDTWSKKEQREHWSVEAVVVDGEAVAAPFVSEEFLRLIAESGDE